MNWNRRDSCEAHVEELAACIAGEPSVSAEAAAHFRDCTECREKLEKLKSVAAVHERGAARIPEPKRMLTRRELERLMAGDGGKDRGAVFKRLRPLVAGGAVVVAVAVIIAMAVFRREEHVVSTGAPEVEVHVERSGVDPEVFVPTMLALHRDVEERREQLLASAPVAVGMKHYRVRDVASELESLRP